MIRVKNEECGTMWRKKGPRERYFTGAEPKWRIREILTPLLPLHFASLVALIRCSIDSLPKARSKSFLQSAPALASPAVSKPWGRLDFIRPIRRVLLCNAPTNIGRAVAPVWRLRLPLSAPVHRERVRPLPASFRLACHRRCLHLTDTGWKVSGAFSAALFESSFPLPSLAVSFAMSEDVSCFGKKVIRVDQRKEDRAEKAGDG